ncbi:MAG: hypothetical protein AABZ74_13880 [Cyanobacteriota bacterium]
MKKIILCIFIILNSSTPFAFAEEIKIINNEKDKIQEYKSNLAINSLLPGYAQFTLDKKDEGNFYMYTSVPLLLVGQGLLLYYFNEKGGINIFPYTENDKHYLVRFGNNTKNDKDLLLYSGLLLSLYGTLISTYSSYSYHRDFSDLNFKNNLKKGKENLGDLVLAPFKAENVFNFDFFPMYPLTALGQVTPTDIKKISDFWKKDKVPFMGANVAPWQGLLLELITAGLLIFANATWEEINYRGILLETSGLASSSLNFGLAHAPNVLYPNTSIEETSLQTVFATLFGFYAAHKTEENNYDFRRMIALHFWHNITSASLSYMSEPEKGIFFINMTYKF